MEQVKEGEQDKDGQVKGEQAKDKDEQPKECTCEANNPTYILIKGICELNMKYGPCWWR